MKKTLAFLLICSASFVYAQSSGGATVSARPVITQFESHPEHARQQAMAQQENILFNAANLSARGERPLWEVAKPAPELPLGDIARMLRNDHATAKKAVRVLEK